MKAHRSYSTRYIHFLELEGNISVLKLGEGPTEMKGINNTQKTH